MTPVLKWSTYRLADGWVLICVDASLEQPGEPEALLGYRRAVHPFHFDEADDPVMDFKAVISEMTFVVSTGLAGQGTLPASRAGAFGR